MDPNSGDMSKVPEGGRQEAPKDGHLKLLEHLLKNGGESNAGVCRFAGTGSHLEIVKYLESGPWDPNVPTPN